MEFVLVETVLVGDPLYTNQGLINIFGIIKFWFNLFLEAWAEILKFVGFLVDLKTPKVHFEIN